ncbi:MAG TPA: hypothetical protein VFE33_31945 [Thermoanaerobaculia bacterium]|nr:hypothetical protein [Thermoanaerobaculia bacterium]
MPSLPESIPIDLSRVTEATRRALYDAAAAVHFAPTPGWSPRYGPDECRLTVAHLFGRWFVIWRDWDAKDDTPEAQCWFVLTVHPSDSAPYGVQFSEV